jgi:hypothetical protein
MIDVVDELLRAVLLLDVAELTSEVQVSFEPPDERWRTNVSTLHVGNHPAPAVNVYLADVREQLALRSTDWVVDVSAGQVTREPPPVRLDCHYLLTAWSPAVASAGVEPTRDEHRLLYAAAAALLGVRPLRASRVLAPGSAELARIPEQLRDTDLPLLVAPAEGFSGLSFFWGTMGADSRWKPVLYFVVTVPVLPGIHPAGPPVTTALLDLEGAGRLPGGPAWIGGLVRNRAGMPLRAASVQLEAPAGQVLVSTETDGDGRFTLPVQGPAPHRLRASAPGAGEQVRDVEVPSPSGDYDLQLS